MDKQAHINYWLASAEDDWLTVDAMFKSRRFVHSLFFAHLCLEKTCKAFWVRDNEGNAPPKIHNLVKLIQATTAEIDDEKLLFLQEFNSFQLEGRYPDYLFAINLRCDRGIPKNCWKT